MKAIHNIYVPILLVSALILESCSSQNKIASNYYADGIYFDPDYTNVVQAATEQPETSDIAQSGFDYYEPGTYTSPYEQELPNSGWSNSLYYGGYSPFGWGNGWNMGIGFGFGNPWYGGFGDMYYPYGGMMYPPYYNPYMYNPYYNPYTYNPYCGFGNPYSAWGPYNPMWGYPGAYYPYGGYGNDYGGYFNANQPDVVFRGNSNPRPSRSAAGNAPRGSSRSIAKGGRIGQTNGITSNEENTTAAERLQNNTQTKTTAASRLRSQSLQSRQRTFTNYAVYNANDSRRAGESRRLYEKTTRTDASNAAPQRTQGRNNAGTPATTSSDKRLERQTQRVIENNGRQQNTSRTYTPQSRTRTYTPQSSDGNGGTPARIRSYTPSSSGGGGGGSRPSGGGSSGGGGRPNGGSGTRR